jgi:hypothetical protein
MPDKKLCEWSIFSTDRIVLTSTALHEYINDSTSFLFDERNLASFSLFIDCFPKEKFFAGIIQTIHTRKSAGYVLPVYAIGMHQSSGNMRLPAI